MIAQNNRRYIWLSASLIIAIFLGLFLASTFTVFAADVTENFDGWSDGSYGDVVTYTSASGMWVNNNAVVSSLNARSGNAVRLRNNASLSSYLQYKGMDGNGKDGGVGAVSFWYRHWDGDSNTVQFQVQYKQGAGSWTNIGSVVDATSITYTQYSVSANVSGDDILVQVIPIDDSERLMIDDFDITDYSPAFEIVKTAPALVAPGEAFTYTLVITNSTGITTTGTVITDVVPANATFASASDGGTESGGIVSWTVAGDFVADTAIERTFVVTATLSTGVDIVNDDYGVVATEWITMGVGAPVTSTVSPLDLSITKTGPLYGVISDTLVYMVTLNNQGVADAENVLVTDTIPVSTTLASSDMGVVTNPTPGVYEWDLGTILSDTMETYYITITVDADVSSGTVLTNAIVATTSTSGDDLSNNADTWETAVYPLVSIYDIQYVVDPETDDASTLEGQTVWVEGVVTAQTGEIDNRITVIEDSAGGAWTGLPLYISGMPATSEGDYLRAVGVVDEAFGLTRLELLSTDAIEQMGTMAVPAPAAISSGDYISVTLAEQWESVYLQFDDAIVSNQNPDFPSDFGEWEFDDGSGGARADDMGEANGTLTYVPTLGDDYQFIRGIGWYSFSNYKLQPRYNDDIAFVAPTITKAAPGLVDPGELYTYTLTLDNAVGYALTNVVLTDTLPISSTFASASDGGALEGGVVVSWTIPTISNWTTVERTFTVTATDVVNTDIINFDYGFQADNWITVTMGSVVTTTVSANVCGEVYVPIYTIQGSGPASPSDGDAVFTEGIVTAVYQDPDQLNGFYIQDELGDGDVTTSDGIFVYTNMSATAGDEVRVAGIVDEYFNLTEITNVSSILVCGTGTITPTAVSLPVATLDTWEQYEGMLLDFSQELYVTEVYNLGRFGEVSLSVNDRLYNPTNITTPGAAANTQQDLNDRSRVQLDDTYTNQYRDPIAYPAPGLTYTNTLRGGDYVANLTGVLDYAFGNYKVQPVGAVDFTHINTRTVTPEDVGGPLKVASFNVLNYFNGDGQGGGFPTSRGADTLSEFMRQRVKIVNAIVAIDADVIGLMEIENDGYGEFGAIQDLVNGLNDVAGAGTYAFIDPGVAMIGTDEIAVGLIYKVATVSPTGSAVILDSSVDPNFNDLKNRPVLAQAFTEADYGQTMTIAVNHLKSKGSDCDDIGDPDTGDGQGNCNLTRESAANALVSWLDGDPTSSGSSYNLIIGDLNSYAMEDPIVAIEDGGYTNLMAQFSGLYAYSYVFSGQNGYLDHALASQELMPFVTGATFWHINADEPPVLDYNEENKTPGQLVSLYGEGPYRASDHDPVVVGLDFLSISITSPTNGQEFVAMDNISTTVPVTVSTPGFTIPADGHWHIWVDGSMDHMVFDYDTELLLELGEHVILAELVDASHQPLGPTDTVTVTVAPLDGILITSPLDNQEFVAMDNISTTVPVTVSTPGFTIPTDGHWHIWVDGSMDHMVLDYDTELLLELGAHVIMAELVDASDQPLGPTDTVTVTVTPLDGILITSPIENQEFVAMDNISTTVPITVSTPGFTIPTDGHWHIWVDGSMDHMVFDYDTELLLELGEHVIMAELVDASHQPLGPTDTVTVTVRAWQDQMIYLPIIMNMTSP